jgi:hypothetical protein
MPGWIDFYLSHLSIAVWLQQFPQLFFVEFSSLTKLPANQALYSPEINLFPVHYTHARCCALLRLGHQDQLIQVQTQDFNSSRWRWIAPNPIPWQKNNQENCLNMIHKAEYSLIMQIMAFIDDLGTINPTNLLPLVNQLSQAFWEFERYCRIWGEVKENNLELAQTRLGLVQITQCLLCYLLKAKFQVLALTEL